MLRFWLELSIGNQFCNQFLVAGFYSTSRFEDSFRAAASSRASHGEDSNDIFRELGRVFGAILAFDASSLSAPEFVCEPTVIVFTRVISAGAIWLKKTE